MVIDTQKLYEALDLITKGVTRPTQIAKGVGVTYRTYRNWMVRSNRGDEIFLIDFDGETMQWAKAITLSTKLALFELRGMVLQEAIYGYDEIQTKDGQIVFAIDMTAAALSEDDREMLGYRKDALLEIDGKLQPVVLKKKAPFAQQIRLLEAAFPDLRPSQTVNQNVNVNGQVGIGFAKPIDYSKGPPAVPPPPARPELPAPVDAEFSEIDDDLAEMLGPDPVPVAPININIIPEITIIAEPDVANTLSSETGSSEPTAFDEPPRRPARTPLEQSLYDELDKAKARKAKPNE